MIYYHYKIYTYNILTQSTAPPTTSPEDAEAQAAINRAIDDVNEKIVMREREGGEDPEETQSTARTSEQVSLRLLKITSTTTQS